MSARLSRSPFTVLHRTFLSMSQSDKPQLRRHPRGWIPYKPALYELVDSKNAWQHSPDEAKPLAGSKSWNQRGYLPHRDEPGLVQFVTFRLADAFPATLRSEWESLLMTEDVPARHRKLEEYLDKGRGACHLRRRELAGLVEAALRFFNARRYDLQAWVLMPNHVHVLFKQRDEPLGRVIGSWKSFTAKEANKILKTTGQFWDEDYWDTYMRNESHAIRTRRYIEANPVQAHLATKPTEWRWSSARFRDQFGRLRLPC
jgi:REP element-mobilizing transposase RayT